jgi:hypothetical protein
MKNTPLIGTAGGRVGGCAHAVFHGSFYWGLGFPLFLFFRCGKD